MAAMTGTSLLICVSVLVSACYAGETCYDYSSGNLYSDFTYCEYGCCGYNNRECCAASIRIGLIVGLCVGGAAFLFFIMLTICLCRRRRYAGLVYGSQPAGGLVVVQQSTMTNQAGVVGTAGVQPGVTYPPYPQYQYPTAAYPSASTATSVYHSGY